LSKVFATARHPQNRKLETYENTTLEHKDS